MSLVVDNVFWTVSESALEPQVTATISKNFGVGLEEHYKQSPYIYSYTYNYSKLIVPLYCRIFLMCESSFPVAWFKNGKRITNNNMMNHEFYYHPDLNDYPDNRKHIHSKSYSIKGHQGRFSASLTIPNVTKAMEGSVVCKHQTFHGDTLSAVIDITVDATPDPTPATTEARILLSGMDEILFDQPGGKYAISFLYFIPHGADCDVYFVVPNNQIVRNSSSIKNFQVDIRPHEDSAYLRYATLNTNTTLANTSEEQEGNYQFIIDQRLGNETKHLVRPFKLKQNHPIGSYERSVWNVSQQLMTDQFRAYFMVGRVYEIMYQSVRHLTSNTMDQSPLVNPIINASIEVFSQMSFTEGCGYKPVLAADATKECGIVSVTTEKLGNGAGGIIIRVILNVTKSCSLLSRIVADDLNGTTTILNITAMSDAQVERIVVFEMPDGGRGSSVKFTNDTFRLRCLIPVCNWEVVGWCKTDSGKKCAWYTWKRHIITGEGVVAEDPNITVTFQPLNNYTAAMDLFIKSVQLNQTGVYGCGAYRSINNSLSHGSTIVDFPNSPEYEVDVPFVNFRLTVREPVSHDQ